VLFRYVDYEINLDKLRKLRVDRQRKLGETDPTLLKKNQRQNFKSGDRVNYIFERVLRRFKSDIALWQSYIEYVERNAPVQPDLDDDDTPFDEGKAKAASNKLSAVLGRALQMHPREPYFWIRAASFEFEAQSNAESARSLMQRAVRLNPKSKPLWLEYFRLEMLFVSKIRRRRKALGLPLSGLGDGEEGLEAFLQGSIPKVVYAQATSEISDDAAFNLEFVTVSDDFRGYFHGRACTKELLEDALSKFPNDKATISMWATRPLSVFTRQYDILEGEDGEVVAPEDAIFDPVVMDALAQAEDLTFARFKGTLGHREASASESEPHQKKAKVGATAEASRASSSSDDTSVVYECIFNFLEGQLRKRRQKRIYDTEILAKLTGQLSDIFDEALTKKQISADLYVQYMSFMLNSVYDEDELPAGHLDKALEVGRSATLMYPVTISVWVSRLDLACAVQAQKTRRTSCSWEGEVKKVWEEACAAFRQLSSSRADAFVAEFSASKTDPIEILDRRLDIAADADDSGLKSSMVQLWMWRIRYLMAPATTDQECVENAAENEQVHECFKLALKENISAPEDNSQIAQQYIQWMLDSGEPESYIRKSYKAILAYPLARSEAAKDLRNLCLSFELDVRAKRAKVSFDKDKRFVIPLFEMLVGEHGDDDELIWINYVKFMRSLEQHGEANALYHRAVEELQDPSAFIELFATA
jgi:hypothetical protein